MNKYMVSIIVAISITTNHNYLYPGRGGESFGGALAGGALGGVLGGAISNASQSQRSESRGASRDALTRVERDVSRVKREVNELDDAVQSTQSDVRRLDDLSQDNKTKVQKIQTQLEQIAQTQKSIETRLDVLRTDFDREKGNQNDRMNLVEDRLGVLERRVALKNAS